MCAWNVNTWKKYVSVVGLAGVEENCSQWDWYHYKSTGNIFLNEYFVNS